MKNSIVKYVLPILLLLLFSGCASTHGHLQVGIDYGIKPLGYTEAGEKKGFETDLWHAVARKAGFTFEIKPMSAGEILQSIEEGEIDVGLAGITIKGDRKKRFDFAIPYYDAGQVILVNSDNKDIKSAKDLKEKTVATRMGTTGYEYISKVKGVKEVRAFPDVSEAIRELTLKKVDAVLFDSPMAFDYVQNEGKGKVKTIGMLLTNEQYGMVLKKGSKYTGRLNNAMRAIGEDGTYAQIYLHWFGHLPESIPGQTP